MRKLIFILALLPVLAFGQNTNFTFRLATHTNAPWHLNSDTIWQSSPTGFALAVDSASMTTSNGYRFNTPAAIANASYHLNLTNGHVSLWLWLATTNYGADVYFISDERSGANPGDGTLLFYPPGSRTGLYFEIQDSGTYKDIGDFKPVTGAWMNVQVEVGIGGTIMWGGIAGQSLSLIGSNAYTGGWGTNSGGNTFCIGNSWNGQALSPTGAIVDDVIVWRTATPLTSAERGYNFSNRNWTSSGGGPPPPDTNPVSVVTTIRGY